MKNNLTANKNNENIGLEFKRIYHEIGKVKSKIYLDNIIDLRKGTKSEFHARYLRAKGCEAGWFGEYDYNQSQSDYLYLIDHKNMIDSRILEECMLGKARIFFAKKENFEEIKGICESILSKRSNLKALTLLGLAYQVLKKDYKTASKFYKLSFLRGSKRGLAYYSYAKYKDGKFISGTVSLILYYICYPILKIFDKSKSNI